MWRLYLAATLFAGIFGTGLALYALVNRETPGAGPLALLLLGAAMLSITEGLSLANDSVFGTVFWAQLRLSITAIIPLAWLLTAVEYAGHDRQLKAWHLLGLLVEPIAFIALVWTSGSHDLVWSSVDVVTHGSYSAVLATRGLAYLGHVAYSYLLIAAGAFLLVQVLLRTDDIFRAQSTVLLVAITVPLVANASFLFGLTPAGIDPTGISFVISGAVIAVGILREQLLSVAAGTREIGRDEIFARLDDPVFIVDRDRTVVDHNRAAAALCARDELVGQELTSLLPALAEVFPANGWPDGGETTIEHDGAVRNYDLQLTALDRSFGTGGAIISLRDVTERTRREQQLDVLNRLLRHNIRNEMNVVRGHAELLGESVEDPDAQDRVSRIIETVDTVTERSDKVGTLTRAFEDDSDGAIDLGVVLADAIENVRLEHPEADIELRGETTVSVYGALSLGVAFEELVANAVEHNDTDHPSVVVSIHPGERSADTVTVRVSDDGPGINQQERAVIERGRETALEHGSGIGLWLVAWIVRSYGGTIDFEDEGDGATVIVRLPRASDENDSLGNPQT